MVFIKNMSSKIKQVASSTNEVRNEIKKRFDTNHHQNLVNDGWAKIKYSSFIIRMSELVTAKSDQAPLKVIRVAFGQNKDPRDNELLIRVDYENEIIDHLQLITERVKDALGVSYEQINAVEFYHKLIFA